MIATRPAEALTYPPVRGCPGRAMAADDGTDDGWEACVHPDEWALAATMHPRRGREFALGRAALRRAIRATGRDAGPMPILDRRPVLPDGTVGSLSHCGDIAVAIAGPATAYRGLGIDLETTVLPERAAHLVLDERERVWLARGRTPAAREHRLLRAFSAKEAALKALDPIVGAPRLRGIRVRATGGGFEAWAPHRPDITVYVTVLDLPTGVLAWTGVPASAP